MEIAANELVLYLLQHRLRKFRDCADIPKLEAALVICENLRLFDAREVLRSRLLDAGRRNVTHSAELPSPLLMTLSGFFGLSSNKLGVQKMPKKMRNLLFGVRTWHRNQVASALEDRERSPRGFTERLRCKSYLFSVDHFGRVPGNEFTPDFVKSNGLLAPLIVTDPLIKITKEVTPDLLIQELGADYPVQAIDVVIQQERMMALGQFLEHWCLPVNERTSVLNLINLNVSQTTLTSCFHVPEVFRQINWAEMFPVKGARRLTNYILMSPSTSFTDFHVDLSGSSAWIFLQTGEKVLYFVEPTDENLLAYQGWQRTKGRGQVFLGNLVDRCTECKVTAGQMIVIPGGWIHAVYTPVDSVAFAGNFLHGYNMGLQVRP